MDYSLWKYSNFWIFSTSCFYCLNRRFSLLEYFDQIFDRNHGLTPLKNSHLSTILSSYFHSLKRHFSWVEYRTTNFSGLCCLKYKDKKISNVLTKPIVYPLWKNCNFLDPFNFLFLLSK